MVRKRAMGERSYLDLRFCIAAVDQWTGQTVDDRNGARYEVRLEYTGPQEVRVNNTKSEADRVMATVKGPASEVSFEMFFARDPARTPLMIRVPLSLGMFSMELAR